MKDIVIIGGGPGGYEAAIRGAQLGAKVVLIEKDEIGGTCLNRGCIPTKALYRNAEIINNIKDAHKFGIDVSSYNLNVDKIQERKQGIVKNLVDGIYHLLKANDIEFIKGYGKIIDNTTVQVETEDGIIEIKTKNIILATGSKPASIPIEGIDLEGIYTSREMLDFKEIPEKLLVIGGGVVGIEFANIFNSFGSEVTVLDALPNIINSVDTDISKRLAMYLKKKDIKINTKVMVKKIEKTNDKYMVTAQGKKGDSVYEADRVLVSVGRIPNISNLGLEEAGIKYNKSGIEVDDKYMTSLENVYAIGDVNGKLMLAHVASHQGIEVVERLMGYSPTINQNIVPSCVFVFPEVATVGKTEKQLKEENIEYNSNKFMFAANGKALALGEGDGFIKVIEADNKIVGVHILGPHASDLIHEAAIIVSNSMRVKDVTSTIHAHPTLAEAFVEAVLGLHNEAIHQVPKKKR